MTNDKGSAMTSYPALRRWLLVGITAAIFGLIVTVAVKPLRSLDVADRLRADDSTKAEIAHVWPLFGGSVHRNMVNTLDKNVPTEWNVEKGQEKNIKWVAQLGSKAYAGPVVSG